MTKPSGKHHTVLTAEQREAALKEARVEEARVKREGGRKTVAVGKHTYMEMTRSLDQLRYEVIFGTGHDQTTVEEK
jgi:hypothetical protein